MTNGWPSALFELLFPRTCAICKVQLVAGEEAICIQCLLDLPQTGFHRSVADNPLQRQFKGRIPVGPVVACYYYFQGGKVQTLLKELKYRGNQEAATALGRLYARNLFELPYFSACDVIVPVPLHASKFRKRGYNQAEVFALGLASGLGLPVDNKSLVRVKRGSSQTVKDRSERYSELQDQFGLSPLEDWTGLRIILVDDVITSGATIETCARLFLDRGAAVCAVAIAWTSGGYG